MLQCIHPHLICKRLLARQHMLALDITVDHQDSGFVIVQIQHLRGHLLDAQLLTGFPPAMSAYHLILTSLFRSHQYRMDDAALLDAVHKLLHFQVVPDMEWVVCKGMQLLYWYSLLRTIEVRNCAFTHSSACS